ncbi:MAG TPA: alpha/beta fold hydrolase [Myxococcaceae bacterium]|nr:alpha/beta fold hydrolase [Myxococcaceae bacterium]
MKHLTLLSAVACLALCACQPPPIPPMDEKLSYRDDLTVHPACNVNGLTYTAATITGFTCAAKEYAFPQGVSEDTHKPIVLLFHGNSSSPADFETFSGDSAATPMLSERLVAAGFKTYAVDFRYLTVDDPSSSNPAKNFDHAWATPIAEHFIESVMKANPSRKVSMVGFSLGTTIIRDALRRLAVKGGFDWSRVQDLVLTAGANHGVSSYRQLCDPNNTSMRNTVACQLGDRTAYTPTEFLSLVNGEADAWDTPCADGEHAFGVGSQCYGHKVQYTTIVMKDVSQGTYQDEFVSEASAQLGGADNQKLELTDNDATNYFYNGLFKNHFGSIRSEHALQIAVDALSN